MRLSELLNAQAVTTRLRSRTKREVNHYLKRVIAERESQLQPDDESADRIRLEAPDIVAS